MSWRQALVALLALAAAHAGLALLPGPGFALPTLVVLFAANSYVAFAGWLTLRCAPFGRVVLFALGYLLLFVGVLIWLERSALFILLIVLYASVFGSSAMLGLFAIFVLSFVVLQPYAFETFIPLVLVYALLWRARDRADALAWRFLALGLLCMVALLFPLVHLALQDSAQTLWRALQRDDVREALLVSLASAGLATLLIAIWGVPLAYALARLDFAGKRTVETLIDLPIFVPQSVAGLALVALLGPGSPVGQALEQHGLPIAGQFAGVVVAQVFVAAPFLIKTALTAFEGVPLRLEQASRSLGASAWRTFVRVSLPLASRGLLVGAALAFGRAISEFGALLLFAPSPLSAPVLVHIEFLRAGVSESRPLATLLLIVCVWVFVVLQFGQTLMPFAWRRRGPRP